MTKIAICDDEQSLLSANRAVVENFLQEKKELATIEEYGNGEFLLADIQEGSYFDLILLDIEMPEKDGMELAPQIKQYLPNVLIMFVTSHLKYAIDSFALSIFRYIPKQELKPRLYQALEDAFNYIRLEENGVYTIQTQTRMEKVLLKNILYIQKSGKNSVLVTFEGESKIRKSLSQVYEEINRREFFYIDRGCIVNIIHIMQVKNGEVILKNGESLPISRSHIQSTKELINSYWGNKL